MYRQTGLKSGESRVNTVLTDSPMNGLELQWQCYKLAQLLGHQTTMSVYSTVDADGVTIVRVTTGNNVCKKCLEYSRYSVNY